MRIERELNGELPVPESVLEDRNVAVLVLHPEYPPAVIRTFSEKPLVYEVYFLYSNEPVPGSLTTMMFSADESDKPVVFPIAHIGERDVIQLVGSVWEPLCFFLKSSLYCGGASPCVPQSSEVFMVVRLDESASADELEIDVLRSEPLYTVVALRNRKSDTPLWIVGYGQDELLLHRRISEYALEFSKTTKDNLNLGNGVKK